jgi:hypothetical protein
VEGGRAREAARLGANLRWLPSHGGLAGVHVLGGADAELPGREGDTHGSRPHEWYESAYNTIYRISGAASSPVFYLASLLVPAAKRMKHAQRMIIEVVWQRDLDGRFEDRRYAIETFERHNEEVKQHVPAENLLVYEVREGWGPLCEFLGVEMPDEPFPHLNDSEVFKGRIRRIRVLTAVALTLGVSLAGLVLLRLGWRRRHRTRLVHWYSYSAPPILKILQRLPKPLQAEATPVAEVPLLSSLDAFKTFLREHKR